MSTKTTTGPKSIKPTPRNMSKYLKQSIMDSMLTLPCGCITEPDGSGCEHYKNPLVENGYI